MGPPESTAEPEGPRHRRAAISAVDAVPPCPCGRPQGWSYATTTASGSDPACRAPPCPLHSFAVPLPSLTDPHGTLRAGSCLPPQPPSCSHNGPTDLPAGGARCSAPSTTSRQVPPPRPPRAASNYADEDRGASLGSAARPIPRSVRASAARRTRILGHALRPVKGALRRPGEPKGRHCSEVHSARPSHEATSLRCRAPSSSTVPSASYRAHAGAIPGSRWNRELAKTDGAQSTSLPGAHCRSPRATHHHRIQPSACQAQVSRDPQLAGRENLRAPA